MSHRKDWLSMDDGGMPVLNKQENGNISFHYTHLSELRNTHYPDPDPQIELKNKTKNDVLCRRNLTGRDIKTLIYSVVHFTSSGTFGSPVWWQ